MADRDSAYGKNRRRLVITGGAVGAFMAAAAMATGSAAPAKADLDDLLDPIIQPILTQVTDSLAGFDPTLATDLTTWTDTFLANLNSLDTATAAATTAASSASSATSAADSPTNVPYDIPITVAEGTEPTVTATVDGASNTLLVDTGSSGLVLPWQDLGSNDFQALYNLYELGTPTGHGASGYSGGIQYDYLTYNVPVDYTTTTGATVVTTEPIDVEYFSYPTSLSLGTPLNFQQFVRDDDVTGILGIGDGVGPAAESPLQADGFTGVTVDIPQNELILGDANPGTAIATINDSADGAPITNGLTETVTTSTGQTVGSATVSDDVDSGGVFGTIPASIDSNTLANGDVVTVSYDGTPLYHYTIDSSSAVDQAPGVATGSGEDDIDSGFAPYSVEPIYIDYTNNSISFDNPLS